MDDQALRLFVVGASATRACVTAALPSTAEADTLVDAAADCAVVDVDTAGLEVVSSLARNPLGPPVVAVAAHPDAALVDAAIAAGAEDCVPAGDADRLAHAVRCAVGRRRRPGGMPADVQLRLLDAVGQAVIATDPVGQVLFWNASAQELYGWSAEEAVGRSIMELTPTGASVEQAEEIMTALRAGLSWTGDFPVQRRDGSTFTALVTNRPLLDADGAVIGVIGVSSDITERVRAELEARRMAAVLANAGDAIITTSTEGVVLSWNGGAESLYGWTAEEAVGQHISFITPVSGLDELRLLSERVRAGEAVRDVPSVRQRRDGSLVEIALTLSPVLDRSGAFVGASSIARDATERRIWERALERAALYDALTGLPNRTLLSDRLAQLSAGADADGAQLAVLFVDLDAFQDVNDSEGHVLGDRILVEVASRLRDAVRPGDTVGRFGGDEFVVLLPDVDEVAAGTAAAALLDAVRRPYEVEGRRLHLSASIGIATAPQVEVAHLLRAADAAVYDAKARGRAQVRTYVGELSRQAEQRLSLSGELRDALEADALHLVYQPVMDIASGAVLGVEALLRWDSETRGMVPPAAFVAVAEKTGLARELDEWVLQRSCREFAAMLARGAVPADAYLAVNVTAANVGDASFPSSVRSALQASGLPAQSLVLEVTETGVMNDIDLGVRMLTGLCELGVRIAIDDFGTGWSSLVYVKRLPASILKLDRSFVARLHEDDADLAIAASVMELAKSTRMTVVAEGVETHAQLDVLRRLGCAAGQGYLWHRPVRTDDVPAALAAASTAAQEATVRQSPPRTPRRAVVVGPEHGLERLWELHGEGASMATIAAALNSQGYRTPSGQRWHGKTVGRVLGEPALAARLDP